MVWQTARPAEVYYRVDCQSHHEDPYSFFALVDLVGIADTTSVSSTVEGDRVENVMTMSGLFLMYTRIDWEILQELPA